MKYFTKYLPVEGDDAHWLSVEEFPKYEVSDMGDIRDAKTKKLKKRNLIHGYWYVNLSKNGKNYHKCVHRLVAKAHVFGKEFWHTVVAHKDHDRSNCKASNLKWCTQQENIKDMYEAGRGATGSKQGSTTLTEEQVKEIREKYKKGGTDHRKLGKEYGVSHMTIGRIVNNKTWNYV